MNIVTDIFNSEIFHLKMGNIVDLDCDITEKDVLKLIKSGRTEQYQHLNVKIPSSRKQTLNIFSRNGFDLVDTQLMYCLRNSGREVMQRSKSVSYREYVEEDKKWIVRIAESAYILDQYHSDTALDDSLCDRYYAEWSKNCCEGFADKVFVAVLPNDRIVGYITLDYKKDCAIVGLAAVDEEYRGKGYFTFLIENTLKGIGDKCLYYGTQLANTPVLKTMGRFGGVVEYSNHVMHLRL